MSFLRRESRDAQTGPRKARLSARTRGAGSFPTRWIALAITILSLAAAAPDLSTPKSAAKGLFHAINAADTAAVRASLYQATPQAAELNGAFADLIIAGKRLGDVAHASFGAAGDAIGRGMLDPSDLDRIEQATVVEKDDRATLTVPGQPRPMSFRKQDGGWRLVINDLTDATPDAVAKQTLLIQKMAAAMTASADEISSGTLKTPEQAVNAIQQRLHNVMLTFERPSTNRAGRNPASGPSTSPTTAPATTRNAD